MECVDLARTGLPLLSYLLLAGALLVGGLLLVRVRAGGRVATVTVAVLILCGGGALVGSGGATAQAASRSCGTAGPGSGAAGTVPLVITQTSHLTGLAPGVAPATITGTIRNTGPDSTFVTAVRVSMVAVSLSPSAAAGVCGLGDYVIAGTLMDVGQMLQPGASADFTGATIGFANKSVNQDACQRAVVQLRYRSH